MHTITKTRVSRGLAAFAVAFAATWVLGFEQPDEEAIDQVTAETEESSAEGS